MRVERRVDVRGVREARWVEGREAQPGLERAEPLIT
jgi:hypothetical protein